MNQYSTLPKFLKTVLIVCCFIHSALSIAAPICSKPQNFPGNNIKIIGEMNGAILSIYHNYSNLSNTIYRYKSDNLSLLDSVKIAEKSNFYNIASGDKVSLFEYQGIIFIYNNTINVFSVDTDKTSNEKVLLQHQYDQNLKPIGLVQAICKYPIEYNYEISVSDDYAFTSILAIKSTYKGSWYPMTYSGEPVKYVSVDNATGKIEMTMEKELPYKGKGIYITQLVRKNDATFYLIVKEFFSRKNEEDWKKGRAPYQFIVLSFHKKENTFVEKKIDIGDHLLFQIDARLNKKGQLFVIGSFSDNLGVYKRLRHEASGEVPLGSSQDYGPSGIFTQIIDEWGDLVSSSKDYVQKHAFVKIYGERAVKKDEMLGKRSELYFMMMRKLEYNKNTGSGTVVLEQVFSHIRNSAVVLGFNEFGKIEFSAPIVKRQGGPKRGMGAAISPGSGYNGGLQIISVYGGGGLNVNSIYGNKKNAADYSIFSKKTNDATYVWYNDNTINFQKDISQWQKYEVYPDASNSYRIFQNKYNLAEKGANLQQTSLQQAAPTISDGAALLTSSCYSSSISDDVYFVVMEGDGTFRLVKLGF